MQLVDENYKLLNPDAEVREVPRRWGVVTLHDYVVMTRKHGKSELDVRPDDSIDYFTVTPDDEYRIENAWRRYVGLRPLSKKEFGYSRHTMARAIAKRIV